MVSSRPLMRGRASGASLSRLGWVRAETLLTLSVKDETRWIESTDLSVEDSDLSGNALRRSGDHLAVSDVESTRRGRFACRQINSGCQGTEHRRSGESAPDISGHSPTLAIVDRSDICEHLRPDVTPLPGNVTLTIFGCHAVARRDGRLANPRRSIRSM